MAFKSTKMKQYLQIIPSFENMKSIRQNRRPYARKRPRPATASRLARAVPIPEEQTLRLLSELATSNEVGEMLSYSHELTAWEPWHRSVELYPSSIED